MPLLIVGFCASTRLDRLAQILMPHLERTGAPHPIRPITGEVLQVKFLSDSEENSLKY
jgi:hypothetical protein